MLNQFATYLAGKDLSDRTIGLYVRAAAGALEAMGAADLVSVTPIDIRLYRQGMVDAGLAATTINTRLAAVRQLFAWAQETGLVASNPAASIRYVKNATKPTPRWLSRNEQHALLRAAERECQLGDMRASGDVAHPAHVWPLRDRAVLVLALNTGLRLAELADLRTGDLEINERSGDLVVRYGKGGKSRSVPLNRDARTALRAWLDVRPACGGDDHVFVSQKCGPLATRSIAKAVEALAAKAGIEASPHMLRHSFARNVLDAGQGLEVVADILGHERLETTRRYVAPGEAHRLAAVEAIES